MNATDVWSRRVELEDFGGMAYWAEIAIEDGEARFSMGANTLNPGQELSFDPAGLPPAKITELMLALGEALERLEN